MELCCSRKIPAVLCGYCAVCGGVYKCASGRDAMTMTLPLPSSYKLKDRPNVLVVPLSPCGFNKAQLVDLVNVCRSSLTEFFSEISPSSQIAVGKAFEALARIRETPPTVVPNHTVATNIVLISWASMRGLQTYRWCICWI